jgi:hypothetical protein
MFSARKLFALLCLAAILLAVLEPCSSGLATALLAPVWVFFGALSVVLVERRTDDSGSYASPFVSAVPARAPPVQ